MLVCPKCGENNPEKASYCLACGTPLTLAEGVSAEERKIVSFLFVDLVEFTARSHLADPEDVTAILRPYYSRLREEIEHFGGVVEKFIGDAVVAIFGVPLAHEDDAERAVRAGLSITEAIDQMNETGSTQLQVRVGVNTGEAVVDLHPRHREQAAVVGDVANTASRLQQIAPVGGVVVGELTYRSTRDAIDYDELEPVVVKGKPDPLPIWQATGASSRLDFDFGAADEFPLVGREHELALLDSIYGRTVEESSPQLVTISGEPGVGKSRLVREFGALLESQGAGTLWRQGHCLSYGKGIAFLALEEIVKAHTGILKTDNRTQATDKLDHAIQAAIEDDSETEWVKARLAALIGTGSLETTSSTDWGESFAAWASFFEAIASSRPLVIVFEDLHWADPALLDFVEYLAEWTTGVPMLILCTARGDLLESRTQWGGGLRNSTTLSLTPLGGDETNQLLHELLADQSLEEQFRSTLFERSGGNPLYTVEFVRMLQERGIPTAKDASKTIPMPETVQAIIAARLDTLSAPQKTVLHGAAVLGKVFWTGAASVIGDMDRDTVRRHLRELARKELLLKARRSSIAHEDEYSFRHPMIRDVAYGQIPRLVRAGQHRSAALWFEGIPGTELGDHVELIAHHYNAALSYARASGGAAGEGPVVSSAIRALEMAGDRALQLDAGKAYSYYHDAIQLLAEEASERPGMLAKATEAGWLSGQLHPAAAEHDYEVATTGLLAQGNSLAAGEVMVKSARVIWERGDATRSRALLNEAVALLEEQPPGRELAFAYAQAAGERWASDLSRECLEWSDRTLDLAERLGMTKQIVQARGFRGCARCELGDPAGLDDVREALRVGLDMGLAHETAVQYNNLGYLVWQTKGPDEALEIYRPGIEFAERRGQRIDAMTMRSSTQEALFDTGRWDELVDAADEVLRWDSVHSGSQAGALALIDKAQVLLWRGHIEDAAALQEEFLPRARETKDGKVRVPALITAIHISRSRERFAAASSLVEELGDACGDGSKEWSRHLLDVLRILSSVLPLEAMEALLPNADVTSTRLKHARLTGAAILAEVKGEFQLAADKYVEAVSAWATYGSDIEQARSQAGAGRCLLELGQVKEAARHLNDARAVFLELEAHTLVSELDTYMEKVPAVDLRDLQESTPPSHAAGGDSAGSSEEVTVTLNPADTDISQA